MTKNTKKLNHIKKLKTSILAITTSDPRWSILCRPPDRDDRCRRSRSSNILVASLLVFSSCPTFSPFRRWTSKSGISRFWGRDSTDPGVRHEKCWSGNRFWIGFGTPKTGVPGGSKNGQKTLGVWYPPYQTLRVFGWPPYQRLFFVLGW